MAEKTTNYQCPACTGPLHYDGASGKLVCDYCGSAYDVKDIEARYAKKQAAADTAAEGDAKKAARLPRQDSPVWSEAEAEGRCPTTSKTRLSGWASPRPNGLRWLEHNKG